MSYCFTVWNHVSLQMSPSTSPSPETPWFQDTKTGNEKQAHYFVRIRELQDELIHREQHNLINAMERLKQLTYPRKRPVVRNFSTDSFSNTSSHSFPTRQLNLKKDTKHKATRQKEQTQLKPVSGKPLMATKAEEKKPEVLYQPFFVMPPLLNDEDVAKIVQNANNTFPSQPSVYLLQPHLPSIPNVERKTAFVVDNRLRLLTLGESEFSGPGESRISGTRKHLHSSKSQRKTKTSDSKSKPTNGGYAKEMSRVRTFLKFDVDPNDPVLFSHCVEDKKDGETWDESTPLPPPNSRPSSVRSKCIHYGKGDMAEQGDCKITSGFMPVSMKLSETAVIKTEASGKTCIPVVNIHFENKESEVVNKEIMLDDIEECGKNINDTVFGNSNRDSYMDSNMQDDHKLSNENHDKIHVNCDQTMGDKAEETVTL